MLDFIMDDIKNTLDDFHKITGFAISLYDENMNAIYHASTLAPVCNAIRSYPKLREKCRVCEEYGNRVCTQTRRPFVYKCHAGLTEAHIPICENNIIIGYMLTGHLLCSDSVEYVKNKLTQYAKECNVEPDYFLKKLDKMNIVEKDYIDSSVNMIKMCASYLYLSQIIQKSSYVQSAQLKDYIDSHYTEDLTIKHLCDKMFISKTKLYKLSLKTFGMGCTEYITQKRLEKAKILLKTTDKSIYQISEETGFSDANYFTRIFKKRIGLTPRQYKKTKYKMIQ